jgi:hypothetical protein
MSELEIVGEATPHLHQLIAVPPRIRGMYTK